jgi:uncharacterized membrane protein
MFLCKLLIYLLITVFVVSFLGILAAIAINMIPSTVYMFTWWIEHPFSVGCAALVASIASGLGLLAIYLFLRFKVEH